MPKQITTETFINKALNIHNHKYSYENTVYIKAIEKVRITCKEHGEFLQTPHDHLKGRGCSLCGTIAGASKTRYSYEDYIAKANSIHHNKYKYDLSNYKNNRSKINIYCNKHGVFEQKASSHLEGHGCKKCTCLSSEKTINFIEKSQLKHNYLYTYTNTIYTGCKNELIVTCNIHGDFTITPNNHLNGVGCNQCANDKRIEGLKNNENCFSKSGYKSIAKNRKCIFYILECSNNEEHFYKIGITVNLKNRYNSKRTMPYNFKIIKIIEDEPETIWNIENKLKQNLISHYTPALKFAGSTRECYLDLTEIFTALN